MVKKIGGKQAGKRVRKVAEKPAARQRRSSSEVRTLILKTARELFLKHSYDRTSTRMIATAAGVAEPMIFRHFGTKERLFEHAVFMPFAEFVDSYIKRRIHHEFDSSSREELGLKYVTSLYELLDQNRGLVRELLIIGFRTNWRSIRTDDLDSPFGQLFRQLDEISARQMAAGQQRGSDARVMTRISFGAILAMIIFNGWLFPQKASRPTKEKFIEELTGFLLYGTTPTPAERGLEPVKLAIKSPRKGR